MGQNGWICGIVLLASLKDHIIRVGENMVEHPCNYKSIEVKIEVYDNLRYESHKAFQQSKSAHKIILASTERERERDYDKMFQHQIQ